MIGVGQQTEVRSLTHEVEQQDFCVCCMVVQPHVVSTVVLQRLKGVLSQQVTRFGWATSMFTAGRHRTVPHVLELNTLSQERTQAGSVMQQLIVGDLVTVQAACVQLPSAFRH